MQRIRSQFHSRRSARALQIVHDNAIGAFRQGAISIRGKKFASLRRRFGLLTNSAIYTHDLIKAN